MTTPTDFPREASQSANPVGLLPLVRRARLLKIRPSPSLADVESFHRIMEEAWTGIRDDFLQVVAQAAGVDPDQLEHVEDEWVRFHKDGKTPMIDFPRVRSREGLVASLDARVCFAICTDELSSKVWSRVGFPLRSQPVGMNAVSTGSARERADEPNFISNLEKLRSLMAAFRDIADEVADWSTGIFTDNLSRAAPRLEVEPGGLLEVAAVTARDLGLKRDLDKLKDYTLSAQDLLSDSHNSIAQYFESAGDLEAPLDEVVDRESAFWFSTPDTVELPNGRLDSTQMLYLMRPVGDTAQTVGVGYEDSLEGQLVRHSALDVSRWIANRV